MSSAHEDNSLNQVMIKIRKVDSISAAELSRFMSRVYWWMMIGILITGLVAYQVAAYPDLVKEIMKHRYVFVGLILLQFLVVFGLLKAVESLPGFVAKIIYLFYSTLTGMTLSVIFLVYTQQSILSVFIVTAVSFGGLSAFGYITKRNLEPMGSFCTMGLFGLIGIMLMSFFVPSLMGDVGQKVISSIGVIVFSGLTAYDTQKIKALPNAKSEIKKQAIHGALILYLDFINLFLNILRLMGQKR